VRVNIATPTPRCPPPPRPPLGCQRHPMTDIDHTTFAREVQRTGGRLSPGRAGLLFAREVAYPDLVPSASLAVLDDLAIEAQRAIAAQPADPEARGIALADYLFNQAGYQGKPGIMPTREFVLNQVLAGGWGCHQPIRDFPGSGWRLQLPVRGSACPDTLSSASAGLTPVYLDPFTVGAGSIKTDVEIGAGRARQPGGLRAGLAGPHRPARYRGADAQQLCAPSTCRRGLAARHCGLNLPAGAPADRPDHVRDLGVLHYRNNSFKKALELL